MTRAALGEGPFATAWDAGRALPVEAAVAEALAGSAHVARRAPVKHPEDPEEPRLSPRADGA